jgi:tetratricopeptide (TPR) repeat protein
MDDDEVSECLSSAGASDAPVDVEEELTCLHSDPDDEEIRDEDDRLNEDDVLDPDSTEMANDEESAATTTVPRIPGPAETLIGLGNSVFQLSITQDQLWKLAEAINLYERALALIRLRTASAEGYLLLAALLNLGETHLRLGRLNNVFLPAALDLVGGVLTSQRPISTGEID